MKLSKHKSYSVLKPYIEYIPQEKKIATIAKIKVLKEFSKKKNTYSCIFQPVISNHFFQDQKKRSHLWFFAIDFSLKCNTTDAARYSVLTLMNRIKLILYSPSTHFTRF